MKESYIFKNCRKFNSVSEKASKNFWGKLKVEGKCGFREYIFLAYDQFLFTNQKRGKATTDAVNPKTVKEMK